MLEIVLLNDFINSLSYPDYDLGIIAGNRTIAPISSLIIGEASDGRVAVESTKLDGAKDHIVVQSSHLFLPIKKEVIDQTIFYIKHRKFKRL